MANDSSLAVITWNLAGNSDYENMDAREVIESELHSEVPDVVIIGF